MAANGPQRKKKKTGTEKQKRGESQGWRCLFLPLVPLPRRLQEAPRYLSYNDPFFLKTT